MVEQIISPSIVTNYCRFCTQPLHLVTNVSIKPVCVDIVSYKNSLVSVGLITEKRLNKCNIYFKKLLDLVEEVIIDIHVITIIVSTMRIRMDILPLSYQHSTSLELSEVYPPNK